MADRPPPAGPLKSAWLALAVAASMLSAPAWAVQPDEMLADPALEARARAVSRELRCVVCQNESIDDSNAELAHDLRLLVRERIAAGDSDRQVIDYVVSRYGDFVLLRPPLKAETWALWFGPAIVLVSGGLVLALYLRRRARAEAEPAPLPLTGDEEDRLARTVREHRR
ncbi:MAG: cytochrome c-type biogenesis protein [Rhodospirillales bacterium]